MLLSQRTNFAYNLAQPPAQQTHWSPQPDTNCRLDSFFQLAQKQPSGAEQGLPVVRSSKKRRYQDLIAQHNMILDKTQILPQQQLTDQNSDKTTSTENTPSSSCENSNKINIPKIFNYSFGSDGRIDQGHTTFPRDSREPPLKKCKNSLSFAWANDDCTTQGALDDERREQQVRQNQKDSYSIEQTSSGSIQQEQLRTGIEDEQPTHLSFHGRIDSSSDNSTKQQYHQTNRVIRDYGPGSSNLRQYESLGKGLSGVREESESEEDEQDSMKHQQEHAVVSDFDVCRFECEPDNQRQSNHTLSQDTTSAANDEFYSSSQNQDALQNYGGCPFQQTNSQFQSSLLDPPCLSDSIFGSSAGLFSSSMSISAGSSQQLLGLGSGNEMNAKAIWIR